MKVYKRLLTLQATLLMTLLTSGCATDSHTKEDQDSPFPLLEESRESSGSIDTIDEQDLPVQNDEEYETFDPKGIYVYFKFNSTEMTVESAPNLQKVIKGMLADPLVRIIIRAHTDAVGSKKANMRLSRLRAEALRSKMIRAGIEAKRLAVDYAGETDRAQGKKVLEDDGKLRRAEFIVDYGMQRRKNF